MRWDVVEKITYAKNLPIPFIESLGNIVFCRHKDIKRYPIFIQHAFGLRGVC